MLAKVFAASSSVHAGDQPYLYCPLLAAAQLINVSELGSEPDLLTATEDVRLWAPECAGKDGAWASMPAASLLCNGSWHRLPCMPVVLQLL